MGGTVTVMLAFRAQSEAAQSTSTSNRVESVLAARKKFVDIALMADVPNEFVLRRAEDVMKSEGQFHHTEVWPQMTPVPGQHGYKLPADFLGECAQLIQRQLLDVHRTVHHLQISAHSAWKRFESMFSGFI